MRPEHYKPNDAMEVIDIIKAYSNTDEYNGFLAGNIIKYMLRYKNKNGVEDLEKAQVYLGWLIESEKTFWLDDTPKTVVTNIGNVKQVIHKKD